MTDNEPTNNTCKLTDDELIARVLELNSELHDERDNPPTDARIVSYCYALAGIYPDLARRLQKANERIRELEGNKRGPIFIDEASAKLTQILSSYKLSSDDKAKDDAAIQALKEERKIPLEALFRRCGE